MPLSFRGAELLSLHEFVHSGLYRHTSDTVVSEHLTATLWRPLASLHPAWGVRSSNVLCSFGCPPACTTMRSIAVPTVAAESLLPPTATADTKAEISAASYRVRTLRDLGLEDCLVVTLAGATNAARDGNGYPPSAALPLVKAMVVVDNACGEAVLRGSDIYAPGVVAATRPFRAGDLVLLVTVVGTATKQPTRAAFLRPEQLVATEPSLAVVLGNPQQPQTLDDTLGSTSTGSSNPPQATYGPCVVVGLGICEADRESVLAPRAQGVAMRNVWNPRTQPSRATLATLCRGSVDGGGVVSSSTTALDTLRPRLQPSDVLFLQNWSSMVPATWLVDSIRETLAGIDGSSLDLGGDTERSLGEPSALYVLDACSAPGGKTSQLALFLSALSSQSRRTCRLFACERSAARHAALCRLLDEHLGAGATVAPLPSHDRRSVWRSANGVVDVHCGDVRDLLGKWRLDSRGEVRQPRETVDRSVSFDYILLDPPCTGLGLRPRLSPHPHSLHDIQQSAAYQRKLLNSCWASLAVGGRLCYSTCTISVEENEDNIVRFLEEHGDAVVVQAWTTEQRRLLNRMEAWSGVRANEIADLSRRNASGSSGGSRDTGAQHDVPLLVLRCGPMMPEEVDSREESDDDQAALDGPGFFVALLEKMSHGE